MKDVLEKFSASAVERKVFVDLTKKLIDVMVEFGLLTLHSVQSINGDLLNLNQIEDIINFDLQFRLQQINDPELLDILREEITSVFINEQKEHKSMSNKSMKDEQSGIYF